MNRSPIKRMLALCATAVVGFPGAATADQATAPPQPAARTYLLRYHFKPGEVVRSRVTHRATVETTIQGNTQTAETSTSSVKLWQIERATDGQITFQHSVESVDMRQQTTGRQEIRYNSQTDKQPPPGYEPVADAIGVPLTTVTIDPSGKVLKRVEHRPLNNNFDNGSQIVVPLPTEAVPVGHVWTVPDEVAVTLEDNQVRRITTRQRFELEKVLNGVATIGVETQIITPVSDPKIRSQLIQRMTRGTIRFDVEAGRVIGQQTDLDERVIGFSGAESSLHFVMRFTEELLPAENKTATRPTPSGTRGRPSTK